MTFVHVSLRRKGHWAFSVYILILGSKISHQLFLIFFCSLPLSNRGERELELEEKERGEGKICKCNILSFVIWPIISKSQSILVIRPTSWVHQVRGNERCPRWSVMCTGGRWGIRTSTGRDGMGGSDRDTDTSNGLRQSVRRKWTTKSRGDVPSLTENTQTRGDVW